MNSSTNGPPASSSPEQKLFIITLRCGRLANRLIIFATVIAFVEEHRYRVANFTFHSYADMFEIVRRDIYCRYPVAKRRSWMDVVPGVAATLRRSRIFYHLTRLATVFNEHFPVFGGKIATLRGIKGQRSTALDDPAIQEKIRRARVVFIYGWGFRATGLVQKHADKIRHYFRPIESLERASGEAVERLRHGVNSVIGVHIRHGDYRHWKRGKYFFPIPRYAEWMREMATQFPDQKVAFLVCSDELRNPAEFPGLSVGFGAGSPVADLYALSKCDYILGPVSTFSQWASFYGKKPMFHLHSSDAQIRLEQFQVSDLDLVE